MTIVKNLILLFASLLIAICIGEFILRQLEPTYSIGPSVTIYDPSYGKKLKKNFSNVLIYPEFTITFSTNSYGFRGPEPLSFPNRPILFLGDSFTVGHGVNDGEAFPDLIRKSLSKRYGKNIIPVVNAGIGDNGNGRWVKFLKDKGKRYDPRLVVLQLYANDFNDNLNEGLFELSPEYELVEKEVPAESNARKIQRFVDNIPGLSSSYLIGLLNKVRAKLKYEYVYKTETTVEEDTLTYRLLEEVISLCNQGHWPVIAISIGIEGLRFSRLERIFNEKGVTLIKIPNHEERPDLYYEVDGHWNKRGHSFAAELIMEELREQGLGRL